MPIRGSITGLISVVPRRVFIRMAVPGTLLKTTEDVRLRRGPSITAPESIEVRKGDTLEKLPMPRGQNTSEEWVRVRTTKDRKVGYLYTRFTEPDDVAAKDLVPPSRTIQVRKKEGKPFKIENINSTLKGVKTAITPDENGRSYSVTVTYEGVLTRGSHQGVLEIKTDDSEEPSLEVPIYVQIT